LNSALKLGIVILAPIDFDCKPLPGGGVALLRASLVVKRQEKGTGANTAVTP